MDRLLLKGTALKGAGDAIDLALFGPFVARATLEVAFTAIMARFDAFRVLAIRKAQVSSAYDLTSRNPLAFNWKSDVQGEEKPKDWDQRPGVKELQRALLCRHFNDIFWQEAFTIMLDAVPFNRGAAWMTTLKQLNPEAFTSRLRVDADRLYSELSKGIHHEFVIPLTAQYDPITVGELLSKTWELVGALGITTCFSPVTRPLAGIDPLDAYEEAQKELYSK